jgi:hypothetical protein
MGRLFEPEAQAAWETVTESLVFLSPAAPQETITAEAACPRPGDRARLYVSRSQGYCFLYPADFEPSPEVTGGLTTGPVLDEVKEMETQPLFAVSVSDVADGLTLDEMAAQYEDYYEIQEGVIGDQPALMYLDDTSFPGPNLTGQVLANGLVYTVWARPYNPERFPQAVADLDRIWETAVGSMAFFSPFR